MAIYFIQPVCGGAIKIGYAANVLSRLQQIQGCSPLNLCVLAIMKGKTFEERSLHRRFAEYRLHGEWFKPGDELMSFIGNLPKVSIDTHFIDDNSLPKPDLSPALAMYQAGYSLDAIGSVFGVSRQRVHQILRASKGYVPYDKSRPVRPHKPIEEWYADFLNGWK